METNEMKLSKSVKNNSGKNTSSILNIFSKSFYVLGIIIVLYVILDIAVILESDALECIIYTLVAIFFGSWGALLSGVDKIVKNTPQK